MLALKLTEYLSQWLGQQDHEVWLDQLYQFLPHPSNSNDQDGYVYVNWVYKQQAAEKQEASQMAAGLSYEETQPG